MPSTPRFFLSLLLVALFLGSCDDPNPVNSSQDIGNLAWRTNSNLLAFAEKRSFVSSGEFVYNLYETDAEGKLGNKVSDEQTSESVPFLSVSADGNKAITVLASNLYRIDLPTGAKTQLTTNVTKVFAISPDQKYILLTHAALFQPIKTVSLLDISGPTVRSVSEWEIRGLLVSQGFWLKDNEIALNLDTASVPFIAIFDTTGAVEKIFSYAQTPARSSAYVPESNVLFVKNFSSLEQLDLESGARTNIADSYVNLDAKGNTLVYIEQESEKNKIFVRNISTGETSEIANDAFRYVVLSPDASKLAYLVETREFYTELKVISVTTP